jgi:TatA/E family protein of Tat protein translocase
VATEGSAFLIGSGLLELSAFDPKRHSALAMLSFPHLVVLFVIALVIFGPQKLPELARMLGKATAEFRKMTNDFRYALEDEVRELERQTRIREEEIASAARAAQSPVPAPAVAAAPEGAVARETPVAIEPVTGSSAPQAETQLQSQNGAARSPQADSASSHPPQQEPVSVPHEKSSDDNSAV